MADAYVRIEFFEHQSGGNLGRALAEIKEYDPDFMWPERPWWHKPRPDARAWISRVLSRHRLTGRLSIVEYAGGAFGEEPPVRWTGFTARRKATSRARVAD